MSKKSVLAAAFSAVAITGATAGAALAGESTGNFERTGKTTPIAGFVAHSICSFSGQNPELFLPPTDPGFEPGRTQSWGQIPKEIRDFIATQGEHPGDACNGHTGFLAGGGSE
jgi:hypothetical protein